MSPITSHVLDISTGRPAQDLGVHLDVLDDSGVWRTLARGRTNEDGRVVDLLGAAALEARTYRISFDTGPYLARAGKPAFYPRVDVIFRVDAATEHYHIPLLLSPFGYSTYRGS
jgi:5-hydroxyisourate hydrolase